MSDQPITADFEFEHLIYGSASMTNVVHRLRRIAPSDAGVLITGEAGGGRGRQNAHCQNPALQQSPKR
jgi:transcriptional regulator with GAF, ATPase, and Fis domain